MVKLERGPSDIYKQEVKAAISPMAHHGDKYVSTEFAQLKKEREANMLSLSPMAYRQPSMDAPYSRHQQLPLSPLARMPFLKSQSLPSFPPINSMSRSRTKGERGAAFNSPPRSCNGRCQCRSLLDSPSTFGREHGSCFGPEHHRPFFKESLYGRAHPYARSSSTILEQKPETLSRNRSHPASSTKVEEAHSPLDSQDKYWYPGRSKWDAERRSQNLGASNYQPGDSQREYLTYGHDRSSTSYGSPSSDYSATDEPRVSRYAHPREHQGRWSVPHEDIYDRYRRAMGGSYNNSVYSYRSGYADAAPYRSSISPDNAHGIHSESYWRRGLSYDEAYSRKMIREQNNTRIERDPPYIQGQSHEQASEPKTNATLKSDSTESAPVPKRGGKLPKHITDMLKTWLLEHADHPYPTEDEKLEFCDRTGLDICQISNWFVNARRRILFPQQQRSTVTTAQST